MPEEPTNPLMFLIPGYSKAYGASQGAKPTGEGETGPSPLMFLIPGFAQGYFTEKLKITHENQRRTYNMLLADANERAERGDFSFEQDPTYKKVLGLEALAALAGKGRGMQTIQQGIEQAHTLPPELGAILSGIAGRPETFPGAMRVGAPPTEAYGPQPGTPTPVAGPGGTQMTERSITVTDPRLNGGRPTNIPSIWNGQVVDQEQAIQNAAQSGRRWQAFGTIQEAVTAAQQRSEAIGSGAPSIGGARIGITPVYADPVAEAVAGLKAFTPAAPTLPQEVAAAAPGRLQPGVTRHVSAEGKVSYTRAAPTPEQEAQTELESLLGGGASFQDAALTLLAKGRAAPSSWYEQTGKRLAIQSYRGALQGIAANPKKPTPDEQRRASEAAMRETGYVHPGLPSPYVTREDAQADAFAEAQRMLDANPNLAPTHVITSLRASNRPLSKDQEIALLSTEYGKMKTALLAQMPEEAAIPLAAARVGNDPRVIPPEDLRFAREATAPPKPSPATEQILFEEGVTTREAFRGKGQARAAGEAGRTLEQRQAAETAFARKTGEEAVVVRPPTDLQKSIEETEVSYKALQRVADRYKAAYVGLGGKKIGRITELFSMKTKDEAKFRAEVNGMVNQIIRQIAGLTQTTQEAVRASLELPDLNLPPDVFEARMEVMFDRLKAAYDTALERSSEFGYKTKKYALPETFRVQGAAPSYKDIAPHIPMR